MRSIRVLCFTGPSPDATALCQGCWVFVLLEGFGQFIERCVPSLFCHLALLACWNAYVSQRHPGLSTKLFKRHRHEHFHWDVRGHPVVRGWDKVPSLIREAVCRDNPLQGNDLPIDTCAPIVLAIWGSHAEEVLAASAKVDFDEGGGEAFGSPPSFCSFRVCPRLAYRFAGSIEHPYDRQLVPVPGSPSFFRS